jgi:hypothetical protein
VVARLELTGPQRRRAGIDVRGDGSSQPYTGWVRRRVVDVLDGETEAAALRRVLAERPR